MKKHFTLLLMLLTIGLSAQERYLDEVFTDVEVTSNVIYGVNATVILLPQLGEAIPIPLAMDVYQPAGDTETARPLVLVFHTGNFLPNYINGQITGTKTDSSVVEICTQLARRGFVAASVDYRTGWNPLATTQPERALGLIQAAYRGVQDGRNAVRYFRADAATSNNFRIDTERVSIFGVGTGGYLALAMATLDEYLEIATTTNGAAKFILDTNGDGVPDTPMVVEPYHGDVNGEVTTVVPADGFGFTAGDTTNYSNIPGFSSEVDLCINVGGALGDISWIDEKTPPIISVQSANDQFAPYGDDVLIVPTTDERVVQVQGASIIGQRQEEIGNNQIWKDAVFNDDVTQLAMDNSATAGHDYYEGTFPWIRPLNSFGMDEGVVIDWWDPNAIAPSENMLPWNQEPHPAFNGSFHEEGLETNEGMSAEKARANLEEVFAYVLPRTCVALDLPCASNFTSATEELLDNSFVKMSPNPMLESTLIQTGDLRMKEVMVFNMSGQLVRRHTNIENNYFSLEKNDLQTGLYTVQIRFEEGATAIKLVVE